MMKRGCIKSQKWFINKTQYFTYQESLFYMNATRKSYKLQERGFISKTKRINARLHENMQHVKLGGMLGPQMSLFYHIFLTPFPSFSIFYHSINHINNPLRPISWLNMGSFLLFPNHVFQVFLSEFVIKCYKTNICSLYLKYWIKICDV